MCMPKESSEIPVKRCGGSCATTGQAKIPAIDPESQHALCHGHADAETLEASDSTEEK